jgi:3-hydroxyacyl-CoA dehydrogenase / enoyl-CoA hydratase / 3-hydroxybutyryl-CoA epimerase
MSNYQHWLVKEDKYNFIWLGLNKQDSSVNTLNQSVLEEFDAILSSYEKKTESKALVIFSAKKTGFIVGADIDAFQDIKDANQAVQLIKQGQAIFHKLQSMPMTTIALIEGLCLGGGLELALACDYRIALDDDKTKLGLPEVMLGIHPGWGGTVRLPQRIGSLAALDLILSGKTIPAKVALQLGLVDAVVPKRNLCRAAEYFALNQPAQHSLPWYEPIFHIGLVRKVMSSILHNKIAAKALPEHYPAPYAVLENWVKNGVSGDKPYIDEAHSVGKLIVSETSRHLVRVFYLQERLKGLAKHASPSIKQIHVIGAGTMGGDIAAWCALRGFRVTLQDRDMTAIAPAIKRAHALFSKKLRDKRKVQAAMDRLMPDVQAMGVSKADVIVEAIYENLEAKQMLFKEVEQKAKPSAILASNTSSILLDEINKIMQNPERLIGIHFFNPVAMMPLVEVVMGEKTAPAIIEQTMSFVKAIDKLPLPVKSSPGFLVNRILMPYLMEAMTLVEEGYSVDLIDQAALDFGMPMGPIELSDTVGLDVCLSVAKNMMSYFDAKLPQKLEQMVTDGKLGKKSGQGFYTYKAGKKAKSTAQRDSKDLSMITNRLMMRIVNESFAVLREGVVSDADLLDAGMIFGAGFAPFRGGPLQYAQDLGQETLQAVFSDLAQLCGDRFKLNPAHISDLLRNTELITS